MINNTAIIRDTGKLNTAIKSIRDRGVKLDLDIHTAACSIVVHLSQHRDTQMVTRLWSAMPKSTRRKALCDWFEKFAPIAVDYNNGSVKLPAIDSEEWRTFVADIDNVTDEACALPFWDMKPEKGAKDAVTLESIIKYIGRKADSKDCPPDQAALIKALARLGEGLVEGAQGTLPLGLVGASTAQPGASTAASVH
jgi:hypothetical protein